MGGLVATEATGLRYSVRPGVLVKYFGQLCLMLALLTCVPLVVSLVSGALAIALRYAVVIGFLGALGWLLFRKSAANRLQVNEAMVLAGGMFLLAPLLMTFPVMGAGLAFGDALFETISGATTTGLSTLASVEGRPFSFLFARSWMQWYGGLGIVVFSLALVVQPGLVAKDLAMGSSNDEDGLIGGTRAFARKILNIYLLLTGLGVVLLLLCGTGAGDAILYTMSAVSTGGFAPHDASLGGLGGTIRPAAVTLICVACSISLPVYLYLGRRKLKDFLEDIQLRGLLVLGGLWVAALTAALVVSGGMDTREAFFHGPVMAFSAQTTSGFATTDPGAMDPLSKVLLIMSMAVGGGVGSTAGGVKILRLLIVLRMVHVLIVRTSLPRHAVYNPRIGKRALVEEEFRIAAVIILLYVLAAFLSWLPFVMLGYQPLDALFEVVSALGTVGLSSGVTAPDLPGVLKGVLCVDMLLGRLEIVAWLVIAYPRTWIGRRLEG